MAAAVCPLAQGERSAVWRAQTYCALLVLCRQVRWVEQLGSPHTQYQNNIAAFKARTKLGFETFARSLYSSSHGRNHTAMTAVLLICSG
jgi:hypothetical protein